jgi:hypothetical protein
MATTTTNYAFIKPALTDSPPDITAPNSNWDTLDAKLKILDDNGNMRSTSRKAATAIGTGSHVEGTNNTATANYTHAEGDSNTASTYAAHAEGYQTTASGHSSHSEGKATTACGAYSHAEGFYTVAFADNAHAEGGYSVAVSIGTHAEGSYTFADTGTLYTVTAFSDANKTLTLSSVTGLSVGNTVDIRIIGSTFEALPNVSITAINGTIITLSTTRTITADWSQVVKRETNGYPAHAEGIWTIATGINSHAEGNSTCASGESSHAEGCRNTASGSFSHVEGSDNVASGANSHSEGVFCGASGAQSHAGGDSCNATAYASFAHGQSLKANGLRQVVFGVYNSYNTTDLLQIGNGTSEGARSNAFVVTSTGNIWHGVDRGTVADITANSGWNVSISSLVKIGRMVHLQANVTKTDTTVFTAPRSTPFTISTAKFRPITSTAYSPVNAATTISNFMDRMVNCLITDSGVVSLDACFGYTDVKQALIDIWYEGQ